MSRTLVTGGAGAIGSNLVALLLERGHEVVVLDDLSSGHLEFVPNGVEFVEASVADIATVDRVLRTGVDRIAHLAALFANQNSVEHPSRDLDVNGVGTLNILEAGVRCGIEKILVTSSSCVYGAKAVMVENDPDLNPETPYAITKLLGEHYADFYSRHHGLDVVVVRPFNCFGPHEYPGRYRNVIPNFFARAIRGEPLPVTGTGDETRDFTYVADMVDGMARALTRPTEPGSIFNLGSGRETRIVDLAVMINEITGNSSGVEFHPRRSWDGVTRRVADISLARRVLGYEPRTDLREGLAATYEWLRGA